MAISREYIINKIKQAIEQLPSTGLVVRENINKYNLKVGYNKISNLRGVFYSEESNKSISISLQDKGQILSTTSKNYLIPYDENSINLKQTDLIFIDNKAYKIKDLGENLKMYCEIKLEEVQGLKLENNYIFENNSIYEITEFESGNILKFE